MNTVQMQPHNALSFKIILVLFWKRDTFVKFFIKPWFSFWHYCLDIITRNCYTKLWTMYFNCIMVHQQS